MSSFHLGLRRNGRPRTRTSDFKPFLESLEDRWLPALLSQQLFPADNAWNQVVANAPTAANSVAVINNIISHYGDGRLHPDFSQNFGDGRDLYGIPYNIVHGNSTPKVQVKIDAYPDESDLIPAPLLANMVLEGDYQNGPKVGVDNRGDSHLLLWDVDNNVAYEFYRASRPSENSDGKWHADGQAVWDMKTNSFRTLGFTSADAAGLSLLAGLTRPDEALPVSQGGQGVINHAIRVTLQNSVILDQYLYPASHTANPGNTNAAIQVPMGARLRLKSTFDVSALNPQSKIIAQAMKDYGMIVADNGSNFFFSGASSSVDAANNLTLTWNDDDIQDSSRGLKSLHFSDFEVVDLTPIVSGLSSTTGQAGSTVTIVGQNFSGAAGHLQVFFGNTAATSVTYLDDGHIQVVVPQGTGTVDVRVQSGVSTLPDSENIKSTIFGYGTSTISAQGKFTYGSTGQNQAPFVVTAASSAANPVTGTSTTLSVLGGDDNGEANLKYTWTSNGPAAVTFSVNGSNAAKSVTANFTQSGGYSFLVTITDAAGLSTTSSVNVTVSPPVNKAPTIQQAAQASPAAIVLGKTTALSVLGADDGGEANLTYKWTSTGPAAVAFSANSSNAAKNATATFTKIGSYTLVVTVTDKAGLAITSSVAVTVVNAPPVNKAPTVKEPPRATQNVVKGTTTTLTVLGADDAGEANLKYTWSVASKPAGAGDPIFSENNSNAAKSAVATFAKAGNYVFTVTIRDAQGLTVARNVSVTVQQKLTTLNVTPNTALLSIGASLQFYASGKDQFGANMALTNVTWKLNGKGSLSSSGYYTAPQKAGGPFSVTVSANGMSAKAQVTVVPRSTSTMWRNLLWAGMES